MQQHLAVEFLQRVVGSCIVNGELFNNATQLTNDLRGGSRAPPSAVAVAMLFAMVALA